MIENYLTSSGKELRANCIKESGISIEAVQNAEETAKIPEDKRFRCYLKCSFLSSNLMDQTGVINMDTLQSLLKTSNPAFIDKVEKNCKKPVESDDLCETATTTCICILHMAREENVQA